MKKKIIGIVICMLVITAALPTISGKIDKKINFNKTENYEFAPGEFIVKFSGNVKTQPHSIRTLNNKYKVSSIEKIFTNAENTPLENTHKYTVPKDSDILSIVDEYSNCPHVEYAEPNGVVYPCFIPNDEGFPYHWALHNTGENFLPPGFPPVYGTPDCDIDAPEAWNIETGSPDVIIAIVDSGVNYSHPDLADNIWINEDEIPDNGIDDDSNGYIDDVRGWDFYYDDNDPMDGHRHGTICAGVPGMIGNNSIGGAGVSWGCQIMTVQIANEEWHNWNIEIAAGIKYAADNGADIISMSFGSHHGSIIIRDALDYAYSKGVFLCAAAGNGNSPSPFYPSAFDNVLSVAATNEHDQRCDEDDFSWGPGSGSNYGDWIDVAAPGNLILTTTIDPTYGYYNMVGGTSLSTPIVAGIAGLIISKNPLLTQEEITTIICENVDPYNSTYNLGSGRVNAYKALNAAPDLNTTDLSANTFGRIMVLTATIENIGHFNVRTPFQVTFYAAYEEITPEDTHSPHSKEIGSVTISSIAMGDQKEATILWITDPAALAVYAVADSTNIIEELNENNNGALILI